MKKLVALITVIALFIGIPVCVFAQEETGGALACCKKFAKYNPEAFESWYKNLGECVSFIGAISTPRDDPAMWMCRMIRINDLDGYEKQFGTQGLGPCVSFFRTDASD